MPVAEWIDLTSEARAAATPFIWATDEARHLVRLAVSPAMVHLVTERRKYWRTLQYLSGLQIAEMDSAHRAEIDALQSKVATLTSEREDSLDDFARAMSELAASSSAPASRGLGGLGGLVAPSAPARTNGAPVAAVDDAPVHVDDADLPKCTNCKTCYQDLGEIFEKTTIMVDGAAKEIGHIKPHALDHLKVTAELKGRIARVVANCDAEIIQ